jgi:hypothetical protein
MYGKNCAIFSITEPICIANSNVGARISVCGD